MAVVFFFYRALCVHTTFGIGGLHLIYLIMLSSHSLNGKL